MGKLTVDQEQLERRRSGFVKFCTETPPPVLRTYRLRLSYDAEGRALWEMPYRGDFDHGIGGIHGSVFGMLIDNAGWFTAALYYETWISTIEYQTRLLEPVERQDLYATGTLVRLGKRIATTTMEVRSQKTDRLAAIGSGSYTVSSVPFSFN